MYYLGKNYGYRYFILNICTYTLIIYEGGAIRAASIFSGLV